MYVVYERNGGSLYRGATPQATYCVLHTDTKRSAKVSDDHYTCYAGCGSGDVLWFLAKLWGNVPLQQVVKRADEEYELGLTTDPEVAKAVFSKDDTPPAPREHREEQLDTLKINRVYRAFLNYLPLLKRHRAELSDRRKLTDSVIDALELKGYRSYKECWEERYLKLLEADLGADAFYGVPGFFKDGGKWRFYAPDGVVFPVVDMNGTIRALSVRKDIEGNGKYVYVSSASRPNGTKSWYGLHMIRNGKSFKDIWVVEGVLKSDVVAELMPGCGLIIGIPSMTVGHMGLPEVFKDFPKSNVILAIDADWREKSTVQEGLTELVKKIQAKCPGQKLLMATWPIKDGKGLDDILASGDRDAISIKRLT